MKIPRVFQITILSSSSTYAPTSVLIPVLFSFFILACDKGEDEEVYLAPSITNFLPRNTVSDTVEIKVDADPKTTAIDFYVNDFSIGTDSVAPFSFPWGTAQFEDGEYELKIVARVGNKPIGETSIPLVVLNAIITIKNRSYNQTDNQYFRFIGIDDNGNILFDDYNIRIPTEGITFNKPGFAGKDFTLLIIQTDINFIGGLKGLLYWQVFSHVSRGTVLDLGGDHRVNVKIPAMDTVASANLNADISVTDNTFITSSFVTTGSFDMIKVAWAHDQVQDATEYFTFVTYYLPADKPELPNLGELKRFSTYTMTSLTDPRLQLNYIVLYKFDGSNYYDFLRSAFQIEKFNGKVSYKLYKGPNFLTKYNSVDQ
jgi:hypothetical protein